MRKWESSRLECNIGMILKVERENQTNVRNQTNVDSISKIRKRNNEYVFIKWTKKANLLNRWWKDSHHHVVWLPLFYLLDAVAAPASCHRPKSAVRVLRIVSSNLAVSGFTVKWAGRSCHWNSRSFMLVLCHSRTPDDGAAVSVQLAIVLQ